MEAIGKNIDSYGSKRNLIEVENNGKPSLASNRKSSFSFVVQWLFFVAMTCLTLFFIAIVVKQEYEIKAIQLGMGRSSESDDFQRGDNMHAGNNHNLEEPGLKSGNQSDEMKAIHSRRRRQIDLSDTVSTNRKSQLGERQLPGSTLPTGSRHSARGNYQQSNTLPFVHLSGGSLSTTVEKHGQRDVPYHWSNWTLDSPLNRNFALVQMHKTTQGLIQAIQIVCSGWYYVYAQLPYIWKSDQHTNLGHSIVKLDKCGRDKPVTVLQTYATYNRVNTTLTREDWRYVGGVVHLSASTHLEVRCVKGSACSIHTDNMHKGGFFGLFMIQHSSEGRCFADCA